MPFRKVLTVPKNNDFQHEEEEKQRRAKKKGREEAAPSARRTSIPARSADRQRLMDAFAGRTCFAFRI
jgi:hypothetical protein